MVGVFLNKIREFVGKKEDAVVASLIPASAKVLDYGCGLGRYLIPLHSRHVDVVGVDYNKDIVEKIKASGGVAYGVDDFWLGSSKFDMIILSHIIEHMTPVEVFNLLDKLCDRLNPSGSLIIATPVLYDEFYDDYDHVKPYTHKAITTLFSDYMQQAVKPKGRLVCNYVWFRRWPYDLQWRPGQRRLVSAAKTVINCVSFILYFVTFGFYGRVTGWVGVFSKK